MTDLTVSLPEGKVNVRVAAWCERDDKLLVCRYPDHTVTLPGGRVKFGETTVTALKREIKEELNTTCLTIEYLGIIENLFKQKDAYHEFLFVYKVELAEHDRFQATATEVFSWVECTKVRESLVPQAIFELGTDTTSHVINQESSF